LSGADNITLAGAFNWSGGIVSGTGNFTTGGVSTLLGATDKVLNNRAWSNQGTVNLSAGRLRVDGNTFTNAVGGVLNISTDALSSGHVIFSNSGTGSVTNAGTLNWATPNDSAIGLSMTAFNNTGTVNVNGPGKLTINTALTNTGTLNIANGTISTGNRSFTNSAPGTITSGNSGTLDLGAGNTLTNAGTISPGLPGTAGTLTITGNLALESTSLLEIDLLGSGTTPLANDRLVVNGNVSLGGTLTASLASGYNPPVGTTADILTASSFGGTTSLPSGSFTTTNLPADFSGTIVTLPAPANPTYRLTKTAPVPACPGVCWDGGGGSSNRFWSTAANWSLDTLPGISDSVYLNMPGGATVLLNDTRTIAALFSDIGNNFAIINGGSLTVTGAATASDLQGELTIAGGNLTVDGFGSMLNVLRVVGTSAASPGIPPGTLGGSGNVTVRGGSSLSGGTFSGTGAFITDSATTVSGSIAVEKPWTNAATRTLSQTGSAQVFVGSGNTITNAGIWNLDGSAATPIASNNGLGTFTNAVGGTLNKNTAIVATLNPSAGLNNNGTLNVNSGGLLVGSGFAQAGTIAVAAGASFEKFGGFTNAPGGVIEGAGVVSVGFGNTLTNAGTISPGTPSLSPGIPGTVGTLTINGDLALTSTSQLFIDLEGGEGASDKLVVKGNASLGGTLTASLAPGYTPPVGSTFDIVTATSFSGGSTSLPSGSFTTTNLPTDFSGTTVTPPSPANPTYRLSKGALVFPCLGVCWDGGGGDNLWSTATNWTLDTLPGLSDTAYLNLLGGASVLLDNAQTIAALFSDAGNNLTIARGGSLTLLGTGSGDSRLDGSLTLQAGGSLTIHPATTATLQGGFSQSGGTLVLDGQLSVGGAFSWSGGSITSGSSVKGRLSTSGATSLGTGGTRTTAVPWTNESTGTIGLDGTGLYATAGLLNKGRVVINSHQIPSQGDAFIRVPSVASSVQGGGGAVHIVSFENQGSLELNFPKSGGWSLLSNPSSQDGIFTNSGRVTLNSGISSWEIAFTNTAAGQVTLAPDSVLSVQNGKTLAGSFLLGAGSTLWLSERHGADATFQAATIQGPGQIQVLGSSPRVRFDAATQFQSGTGQPAGLPGLVLGSGGTVQLDGAARWSTYSQNGGSLGGVGTLEVLRSYARTGGSVASTLRGVSIHQAAGDLRVADFSVAGPLTLRAEAGRLNLSGGLEGTRILASGATGLNLASGTRLTADDSSGVTLQLVSGSGAFRNDAGSAALSVADDASWQVYSASPFTPLENLGGLGYDFKQYGKAFGDATAVAGSGNGLLYAYTPSLTASLSGSTSKVYDGNLTAVVDPAQVQFSGVLSGDAVSLAASGPAFYGSRDVGSGKLVTLTGVSVAASQGAIPVYGYRVADGGASGSIGVITPATVFGGFQVANKLFDGSTAAGILSRSLSGVVPGDQVALEGGSASFLNAAVGSNKPVLGTGFQLGGADRSNYTLVTSSLSSRASILAAPPPPPLPPPQPPKKPVDPRDLLPPLYPIFPPLQLDPLIQVPSNGPPEPGAGAAQVSSSAAATSNLSFNPVSDLGGFLKGSDSLLDRPQGRPPSRDGAGVPVAVDLADPQAAYRRQEAKAPAIADELGLKKKTLDQVELPSSESLQEWLRRNAAAVRKGGVTP